MNDSFLYCWTDHPTRKLYIGRHKGRLDDGYICSQEEFKNEYNKRPQDFTRHIIAEGTTKDIGVLERKILKAAGAARNSMFYNKHIPGEKFIHNAPHTTKSLQKMRTPRKNTDRMKKPKSTTEQMGKYERTPEWRRNKSIDQSKKMKERMAVESPEERKKYGRIGNTNNKGKHWFHNGKTSIMSFSRPKGFIKGRINK